MITPDGSFAAVCTKPEIITRDGAREMLNRYGLDAKKRFGQHYLTDRHVLAKILRAADVGQDDCVLEIGPGLGAVTQALAERAGHVSAVEIDIKMAEALRDFFKNNGNVHIITGDFLKTDLRGLLAPYGNYTIKAVANLPYYITTPVIMGLLEGEVKFKSITVMVQREVAARLSARPSTKEYGALTLAARYYASVEIAAYVPPNAFMPRPDVDSAVVHIIPYTEPTPVPDRDFLFFLIRAAFGKRRKTLVNALDMCNNTSGENDYPALLTKERAAAALAEMNLPPDIRGESLGLDEFVKLSEILRKK